MGEFFLLTSNYCNMLILANELTQTNSKPTSFSPSPISLPTPIPPPAPTPPALPTLELYTQNLITYSTNHVFLALPVTCQGTNISLREGDQHHAICPPGLRFPPESLLDAYYQYLHRRRSNQQCHLPRNHLPRRHRPRYRPFRRRPGSPPSHRPAHQHGHAHITSLQFDTNGLVRSPLAATYGPGTVALAGQGATTLYFVFNKVGPTHFNFGPGGDQATASPGFIWGSFDGTTNLPVIYPVGTSLTNFVGQVILQTFPAALPAGSVGIPYAFVYANPASGVTYTNTFSGAGGQAPYSFSLATGSVLPSGLALTNRLSPASPTAFSPALRPPQAPMPSPFK